MVSETLIRVHPRLSAVSPGNWARIAAMAGSGDILWAVFPPAVLGSDGAWFALAPILLMARHGVPRKQLARS